MKAESMGISFDLYQTCLSLNNLQDHDIYDAVVLGAKRIGHGCQVAYLPKLAQVVKEQDICLEVSPVSNFILGHVLDLRNHPARGLLH